MLKKQEVGTDAMTSPDINGGTIDGATIGASSASTGAFTTISASGNAGFVNIYYSNIWASDCSFINKDITKYVYFSHCFLKINQKKLVKI